MAVTIQEGVLWTLEADDSQLAAAYKRAEASAEKAGAAAQKAAQAGTKSFSEFGKEAGAAGDSIKKASAGADAAMAKTAESIGKAKDALGKLAGAAKIENPLKPNVDTSSIKSGAAALGAIAKESTLASASLRSVGASAEAMQRQVVAAAKTAEEGVKRIARPGGNISPAGKAGVSSNDNLKPLADGARDASEGFNRAGLSVDKFNAGLDRVREFAWNNTGFSGDEIDRVINPLQGVAAALGVIPTIAIAAFAAAGVAAKLYVDRLHEISVAAHQLSDSLTLSGRLNAFGGGAGGAQQFADQLTRMSSAWDVVGKGAALSTDEVKKFGAEVGTLPRLTSDMAAGFADLARAERLAFGAEGVDMVQGLVSALKQPEQALQSLIANNLGLSVAQRQSAQTALDSGNSQRQASTYFKLVTDEFVRQKAEAVLLDAAQNSLSSTTRAVAEESLAAARASGDFEGALERLGLAGSDAAKKLLGAVGAIRSIRAEMARGLSGIELSNELKSANEKLYPLHTAAQKAGAEFEKAAGKVKTLETNISNATLNLNRMKMAGEEGSNEFKTGAADVARMSNDLAVARANASALGGAMQRANEALEGGTSAERATKALGAKHDIDKDEISRERETVAILYAQRADLVNSTVAKSEEGAAKIREINDGIADHEQKLSDARKAVRIAQIDAELAEEKKGSDKKKQLEKEKFELETQGVKPGTAAYIAKESAFKTALDGESEKAGGGGSKARSTERKSAADSYIESLKQSAEAAQAEAENWGKSNVERAKAVALARAKAAADKEGKTLTEEQTLRVMQFSEAESVAKQRVEDLRRAQQELNAAVREFAGDLVTAFDSLIVQGQKANQVFANLARTLASSALRGLLTGEGAFGKLFGLAGSDGAVGGILGGLFGGMKNFAGFKANGGTIPAGSWGIAGERGPELITGPANVTPSSALGGSKVTIHNYAAGVKVTPSVSRGEVTLVVAQMLAANNADRDSSLLGRIDNQQRRA